MKLYEIVNAKNAFKQLTGLRFASFSKSRDIAKTYMRIEEEHKFFVDEQLKLINEYVARDENNKPKIQNGNFVFDNIEAKRSYETEMQKLLDTEVADFVKIELSENDFVKSNDLPTPDTMIQLDSFINWM